ncbi:MAG: mechanosensitive ion channel [Planctomycetota bacterium]
MQITLTKVEQDAALAEDVKSAAVKSYREAIEFRKQQAQLTTKLAEFVEKGKSAPSVDELKKELSTELPARTFEFLNDASEADKEFQVVESGLAKARESLATLNEEPARRAERRIEIPKELSETKERLGALEPAIEAARQSKDNEIVKQARIAKLLAEQAMLRARGEALQSELDYYLRTGDTLTLSRDLMVRKVGRLEDEQDRLQKRRLELAKSDAAKQEQKAEELSALEAIRWVPSLGLTADRNKELAQLRTKITQETEATLAQSKQVQEQLQNVEAESQQLEQRVRAAGLTNAIGLLLRQKQNTIPSSNTFRRQLAALQPELTDTILLRQDIGEERAGLASIDDKVDEIVDAADNLDAEKTKLVRQEASELLSAKRDNLDQLIAAVDRRQVALTDLDTTLRELIAKNTAFSSYISERILWVASTKPISAQSFRNAAKEFGRLAADREWRSLPQELSGERSPGIVGVLMAGGLLAAFSLRHWGRSRLRQKGELVRATFLDSLPATLEAFVWTFIVSSALPLAVWAIGTAFVVNGGTEVQSLGRSLVQVVVILWGLEFLLASLHPMGLAEAHFRWPATVVAGLRRRIRSLGVIGVPVVFLFCFMEQSGTGGKDDSLERIVYLLLTVIVAMFFSLTLEPVRGWIAQRFAKEPERLIFRSRYLVFLGGILFPVTCAGLEVFGYHYTAVVLMRKGGLSLLVMLGYLFAHELTVRVILVAHGRTARERTQARREELLEKKKAGNEETDLPEIVEDSEVDLYTISAQTRRLFNGLLLFVSAGLLWIVWADVLPAFSFLDQYSALTGERMSKEVADHSVSIADLFTTAILLLAFFILYRNVSGLLQFFLIRRFSVDRGTQYAVTMIAKYVIGSAGLVLVAGKLGFEWSRVQWLLAAASVGLGFGLQEIVANFVSGLILLVEQPVRVGDIVTIDGITGVVARIRMRATTITNWDRQDLIVPNKDLITGRILNWTLSSGMNRVVVNVGIAYGSDVSRAKEILRGIVHKHPLVLEDPAPRVFLEGFGESNLKLVLHCFLGELDSRITVVDELHMAIHAAFARGGIEIAFPQQDIRVRSVPEELLFSREETEHRGNPEKLNDM